VFGDGVLAGDSDLDDGWASKGTQPALACVTGTNNWSAPL
jgi:hypothetical protein